MKYKAIGFDLDGTLVNTYVNHTDLSGVNITVLRSLGFPVDEIWVDRDPISRQPFYEWLKNNGRYSEKAYYDKILDNRCLEIEKQGAVGANIYLGIMETLSKLKNEGYKLGVVTRGGHEYAIQVLSAHNMLNFFDVIHGRDDFSYSDAKPSPMAMVHLSEDFGVPLEDILYVGDSITDYQSAHDAGVDFAGVLTGGGSVKIWSQLNVMIINSVADIVSIL